MNPVARFGQRSRDARKTLGWSQRQLAEEMRSRGFAWTQTTASKTESADRPLLLGEAFALADILGVTLDGEPVERGDYDRGVRDGTRWTAQRVCTYTAGLVP